MTTRIIVPSERDGHPEVTPQAAPRLQRNAEISTHTQVGSGLGASPDSHAREAPGGVLPHRRSVPPAPAVVHKAEDLELGREEFAGRHLKGGGAKFDGKGVSVIAEEFAFLVTPHRGVAAKGKMFGGKERPARELRLAFGA